MNQGNIMAKDKEFSRSRRPGSFPGMSSPARQWQFVTSTITLSSTYLKQVAGESAAQSARKSKRCVTDCQ